MKRRTLLKTAAGTGLALAAGFDFPSVASSSPAKDTVTIGINNDIVSWDPLVVSEWYTTACLPTVMEATVTNKNGPYIPWLLESIQATEPTRWRMRLRPGIKFHDGEVLDAQVLKWNLDLYADANAKYPDPGSRVLRPLTKEVRVLDTHTVELITTQPSALVYEGLTRVYILPPSYFQKAGRQTFAQKPVGTGAWRFREWQKGSRMVFDRNDNYWAPKPNFTTLVYRTIPESVSRVSALVAGEIDMTAGVDPDQVATIRQHPGLRAETGPGTNVFIGLDALTKPFSDVRVRQAVNFGVNWDEIIKRVLLGFARRNVGLFYPFELGADPAMYSYYPYDVQKAKGLLAEAGYSQGFSVTYYYALGLEGTAKNDEIAQAVAADLANIGIKVNLQQLDPGTFYDVMDQRKFVGGMFQYDFTTVTPAGRFIYALLDSHATSTYWKDPKMDELIEAYVRAVQTPDRIATGKVLHRYITEQAPFLFAYQQQNLFGASNRVIWTPWLESPFHPESMRVRA